MLKIIFIKIRSKICYDLKVSLSSSALLPVVFTQVLNNELVYVAGKKNIIFLLSCLKYHIGLQYKILSCISGVDFLDVPSRFPFRFSVVYDLLSIVFNTRVRVKIFLNEVSLISSAAKVFINANWWEREVWDMFGIWFENHPDLRRILSDYGFDGFPLRKDFPLTGYFEVAYDLKKKRVISKPCEFHQEFRSFFFESAWT